MNNFRILASFAALAAIASAHAVTTLYFGDASGSAINSLAAPAVGSSFTLSVWYSSDVDLIDGEILLGFDHSMTSGTAATPLDGKVGLASTPAGSVAVAPGVALTNLQKAGAGYDPTNDTGGLRPYGLSIAGVTGSSFLLPATQKGRLFDVTFKNLGIAAGQSSTLSFYTSPTALLYRSYFLDGDVNEITPQIGSVTVSAAPVPEPTSFAVMGLGAIAMIRRRRKA